MHQTCIRYNDIIVYYICFEDGYSIHPTPLHLSAGISQNILLLQRAYDPKTSNQSKWKCTTFTLMVTLETNKSIHLLDCECWITMPHMQAYGPPNSFKYRKTCSISKRVVSVKTTFTILLVVRLFKEGGSRVSVSFSFGDGQSA